MILADYHIEFAAHGIALFNALALQGHGRCKKAPPGRPVRCAPLIYTTLLKSAAFTVVLACFKILEEAALGMYRGDTFRASMAEIGGGTWKGILSLSVLVCALLIPFFGFTELARVFGTDKLQQVFFRPRHLLNLPKEYSNP